MRRSESNPISGVSRKKSAGGNKQEEKRVSLSQSLVPFKEYQSGESLSSSGYRVGQHIAAGADGDVFRAVNLALKREVAVKRIRVTSNVIQRHVQQEVAAVFHARKMYAEEVWDKGSIGHPCIVGYLDWFAGPSGIDREVYIVMELCNFGIGDLIHTGNVMRIEYEKMLRSRIPLQQLQAASKGKPGIAAGVDPRLYRFPEREILKVLFQMLTALAFLNRHGIFHRDVKSENILWKHDHPNEGTYKLADFGVAFCEADANPSKRHDDCGTLWTMAPELLGRRPGAGPSCDSWSLAVVLFEMALYEKPFNSLELLAYRNAGSESMDGFWNSMIGEKKSPAGSTPATRWGSSNPSSPSNKSSPTKSASSFGGKPQRVLTKQASVPTLPSVSSKSSLNESPTSSMSPPTSPLSKLGKAIARRSSALNNSAPAPLSLPRAGSGEEETPISPVNASVPSTPSQELQARKRSFLRKRGALRWIYSEELRSIIFEDLLEEDASCRPTPTEFLENPKFQGLLASFDVSRWGSTEDLARCSTLGAKPILRPSSATSCGSREAVGLNSSAAASASVEADAAVLDSSSSPVLASNALRRLTPEAFLAVLKVDRKFDAAVYSQQNFGVPCDDGVLTQGPAELT